MVFSKKVWVGESDFDVGEEYSKLLESSPHSGAVVFFTGLVRDLYPTNVNDEMVSYLELEHYPEMTERLCEEILDEANQRFPFDGATVLHRVGKLAAGEQIVMVAISSRHRENAFQAAQFVMDYLKTRATFWKKEVGSKGAEWLGVKDKDRQAAERWGELND
ncbi:MAG: molybdenum cofactor biosynthesis protein MoaE [Gammaproteobacteria bacterium]|nr:molybdenum cofactor biosynthesis protein MoaE [Gammaproteobacteria bacterium]